MVGNLTTVLGGTVGFLIGGKIVDILDSEEQSDLNNAINQTLTKNPDNVSNKWNSQKNLIQMLRLYPSIVIKLTKIHVEILLKLLKKVTKKFKKNQQLVVMKKEIGKLFS